MTADDDDSRIEKENQKFSTLGNETVVNVKLLFNVTVAEERVENNANGFTIYQGWAAVGSSETETVWLISKLTYDGNNYFTDRAWADGEATFDKAWNLRAGYDYTY